MGRAIGSDGLALSVAGRVHHKTSPEALARGLESNLGGYGFRHKMLHFLSESGNDEWIADTEVGASSLGIVRKRRNGHCFDAFGYSR
jgi:hypothetical protein